MKTLDEQRRDTADRLTTDTGFEVSWMGSCFSLWDGSNRWFPLYTVAQVLNRAGRLKARRDLVEPTPATQIEQQIDEEVGGRAAEWWNIADRSIRDEMVIHAQEHGVDIVVQEICSFAD